MKIWLIVNMQSDYLLRDLLVHQVTRTGEREDKDKNCGEVRGTGFHDHREKTQQDDQDAETYYADDDIKESCVHCIAYCR